MVRGSSRRVVVLDAPDKRFFEQAIFIVREESRGVTSRELLEEARRVARDCTGGVKCRSRRDWRPIGWAALGSGVTGLLWLAAAWI